MNNKIISKVIRGVVSLTMVAALTVTMVPTVPAMAATADTEPAQVEIFTEEQVGGDYEVVEKVSAGQAAVEPVYAFAITSAVNVHVSQSTSSSVLFSLVRGHALIVNQTMSDGEWVQVIVNGYNGHHYGYILNSESLVELRTLANENTWRQPSASQAEVRIVNASVLNVHAVAGLQYTVIGSLTRGQTARVIGISTDGWVEIRYLNDYGVYVPGYVSAAYVQYVGTSSNPDGTPDIPPEQPTEKVTSVVGRNAMAVTNGTPLNVHSSPSTQANIIAAIPNGAMVTAVAKSRHWVTVRYQINGRYTTGYVYRQYVTLVKSTDGPRLSKRNYSMRRGQSTYQYLLGINYSQQVKVTWSSSNKNVLTVSKNGKMTAKKKGTVTLTCKYQAGNGTIRTVKTKIRVK